MSEVVKEDKKVIRIEIHHLDELGYGPNGEYTRREWRELCMEKLLAGKEVFEGWQKLNPNQTNYIKSFAFTILYADGEKMLMDDKFNSSWHRDSLDYIGQVFADKLVIVDYAFHQQVLFDNATFLGKVFFLNSTFTLDARFDCAIFNQDAWFEKVTFESNAVFNSSQFNGLTNFQRVTFNSYSGFNNASIYGDALFNGTFFNQGVMFENVNSYRLISFDNVSFYGGANSFTGSVFVKDTWFRYASFNSGANFINVVFNGVAGFYKAQFIEGASFDMASFKGNVGFTGVQFDGITRFSGAQFEQNVSFVKAKFQSQSLFGNTFDEELQKWSRITQFFGKANFENAEFRNVGHFERVQFIKHIPSFLGVDTATTRLEFSDEECFPKSDSSESAVKSLEHLKRLADEHGQTDQALMFNALELNAKRLFIENKLHKHEMQDGQLIATGWLSSKVNALTAVCNYSAAEFGDWCTSKVTHLYEVTSDYGRSYTRPLKVYLCFLLITYFLALLSAANHSPKSCEPVQQGVMVDLAQEAVSCPTDSETDKAAFDTKLHLSGYRAAFEYTLYRSAGVLDFSDNGKATDAVAQRLFGMAFEPWWMRAWGVFKAISTTALLFLMALGLRNKYRVK